jgi:hypothetical protein
MAKIPRALNEIGLAAAREPKQYRPPVLPESVVSVSNRLAENWGKTEPISKSMQDMISTTKAMRFLPPQVPATGVITISEKLVESWGKAEPILNPLQDIINTAKAPTFPPPVHSFLDHTVTYAAKTAGHTERAANDTARISAEIAKMRIEQEEERRVNKKDRQRQFGLQKAVLIVAILTLLATICFGLWGSSPESGRFNNPSPQSQSPHP